MMSKAPIIVGGTGMLVLTVLLIGAAPVGPGYTRWEYGTYVGSPGNLEWQGETTVVRATTVDAFFKEMGFVSEVQVSARSGRIQSVLFNLLGQQGWELVDVAIEPERETYWFKRPRQ